MLSLKWEENIKKERNNSTQFQFFLPSIQPTFNTFYIYFVFANGYNTSDFSV